MFDVFQISYGEINAERNFLHLKTRFPLAKRITGVKGIHAAHRAAAERSKTEMIYIVDGDNRPENMKFSFVPEEYDRRYVHLWYARNPVNGLEYGWGGIKLFPRETLLNQKLTTLDMTTSHELKIIPEVTSTTLFDEDTFSTWRSAFREAAKLSLSQDTEARARLDVWLTRATGRYANACLRGASMGRDFALKNAGTDEMLKINDYDWLEKTYAGNT
jgi:hypothetical protein